ncbi:MAG TPA: hypothetical protein VMW72_24385 [Sedimentisphaerales bacterium]|nr:hypothetical protein [Sedimentisphaerales bacterium]
MKHFATSRFWDCYNKLSPVTQSLADKNFALLRQNPHHPSLKLKKIGKYWSVRTGLHYRALGIDTPDETGIIWFWIGSHSEYNRLIAKNY